MHLWLVILFKRLNKTLTNSSLGRPLSVSKALKVFSLCGLLLLASACANQSQENSYGKAKRYYRIIGGERVIEGSEFSNRTVLLRTQTSKSNQPIVNYEICTGTVISKNIILTAAHCVLVGTKKLEVVFTDDLQDLEAPVASVKKIIIHPTYAGHTKFEIDENIIDGDIALVKIEGEIPANYIPVPFVSQQEAKTEFSFVTMGFGNNTGVLNYPAGTDLGSGVLRVAATKGISYDPNKNFFISDHTQGSGACNGDSGGPALIRENEEYKILGITRAIYSEKEIDPASGMDACQFNGIYMSLCYFQPWIEKTIQELNKN